MEKKNWIKFLLVADCLTAAFVFTIGLIVWLFLVVWCYEPDKPYFNLNEFILQAIIITAIYVTIATTNVNSIMAFIKILKDKPLTDFNKTSIWIMKMVMVVVWGGILFCAVTRF